MILVQCELAGDSAGPILIAADRIESITPGRPEGCPTEVCMASGAAYLVKESPQAIVQAVNSAALRAEIGGRHNAKP